MDYGLRFPKGSTHFKLQQNTFKLLERVSYETCWRKMKFSKSSLLNIYFLLPMCVFNSSDSRLQIKDKKMCFKH